MGKMSKARCSGVCMYKTPSVGRCSEVSPSRVPSGR